MQIYRFHDHVSDSVCHLEKSILLESVRPLKWARGKAAMNRRTPEGCLRLVLRGLLRISKFETLVAEVYKAKRHFMTLVELLMVILILSMVTGLVGYNMSKALQEQRFRADVQRVVNFLNNAQSMMLVVDKINADVIFSHDEQGIHYKMERMTTPKHSWKASYETPRDPLKATHSITLISSAQAIENDILLEFKSKGSRMTKGILRLAGTSQLEKEGMLVRYIALPGYPGLIKSYKTLNEAEQALVQDEDFERRLAIGMQNELQHQ